jgi:hypothetical protein
MFYGSLFSKPLVILGGPFQLPILSHIKFQPQLGMIVIENLKNYLYPALRPKIAYIKEVHSHGGKSNYSGV